MMAEKTTTANDEDIAERLSRSRNRHSGESWQTMEVNV
jgi:hypothetical protein